MRPPAAPDGPKPPSSSSTPSSVYKAWKRKGHSKGHLASVASVAERSREARQAQHEEEAKDGSDGDAHDGDGVLLLGVGVFVIAAATGGKTSLRSSSLQACRLGSRRCSCTTTPSRSSTLLQAQTKAAAFLHVAGFPNDSEYHARPQCFFAEKLPFFLHLRSRLSERHAPSKMLPRGAESIARRRAPKLDME
ncbi:hypothetical protein PG984_013213 [Apiospora sp. TS-2023a]